MNLGKHYLIHPVCLLQNRVNNLSATQRKTSFVHFKIEGRNTYGLNLIDTGNLVHSAIVTEYFWDLIRGKISKPMDQQVGTADGQSKELQVLEMGKLLQIYLEGMDRGFVLKPLVTCTQEEVAIMQMTCTQEEVAIMPI